MEAQQAVSQRKEKKTTQNGLKPMTPKSEVRKMLDNYERTKDAAVLCAMSESELISVAKETNAFVKVRTMNYCRIDILLEHFEKMRHQEADAGYAGC